MSFADRLDSVTDHFLELMLDILADNKYYFVKSSLNSIMNGIIHDNVMLCIYRLQLFDSTAESGSNSGCHD